MASGNPARKATERKISQVGDFKKRVQSIEELPSGLVVKLRNPGGLNAFLGKDSQGEIPNSLMPLIQKALKSGNGVDVSEVMPDGELDLDLLADMQKMMDNIAVKCMVDPDLQPKPTKEADRREDVLYADELPDDDKQFIFAWLSSGVSDLETFRQQRQAGVDAVAGVASPQGTTE